MKLNILYEDEHIIVCNKPAGISSQTERGFEADMVSTLMNHLHQSGVQEPYIGVIHRLDKPVSGVMVYAKNKNAAAKLSKQLTGKGFSKRYYAIVMSDNTNTADTYGILNSKTNTSVITLEDYLLHDVKSNSSSVICSAGEAAANSIPKDAKLARLNYSIVSSLSIEGMSLTLLDIELLTGRHHQIRVQLSHAGQPILGDMKYNKKMSEHIPYKIKKTGLALCAYSLSFKHPTTNKDMNFTCQPKGGVWDQLL